MTIYDIAVRKQEIVYLRGLRLSADPRLAEAAAKREHEVSQEITAAESALMEAA